MTLDEFKASLNKDCPSAGITATLQALWWDGKGRWSEAHEIAQELNSQSGAWIHAYLHRKEGDVGNARYWYSHASRVLPNCSLSEEWQELATAFLAKGRA